MDQASVLHNGQTGSNSDTIISTQTCTAGFYPVTINYWPNWITLEIMLNIGVLFTDHVKMGLKYNARCPLVTGSGRHSYQDITSSIFLIFKIPVCSQLADIISQGLFMTGAVWNLKQIRKMLPDFVRF